MDTMLTRKMLYVVLAVCMTVGLSTFAFAGTIRLGGGGGGNTGGGPGTTGVGNGGTHGAVITGTQGKTMTVATPSGNTITPGTGVKK